MGFDNDKNFKVELGYNQTSESKSNTESCLTNPDGTGYKLDSCSSRFRIKTRAISLDFKPYTKLSNNLLAFGIAGLSHYDIELRNSISTINDGAGSAKISKSQIAPSLGLGFEVQFTDNFFARAQAKYSFLNKTFKYDEGDKAMKIKGAANLALGVGVYF